MKQNLLAIQSFVTPNSDAKPVQLKIFGEVRDPAMCSYMNFDSQNQLKAAKINTIDGNIVAVSFVSTNLEVLDVGIAPSSSIEETFTFDNEKRMLGFQGSSSETLAENDPFSFENFQIISYQKGCDFIPVEEEIILPEPEPILQTWTYAIFVWGLHVAIGISVMIAVLGCVRNTKKKD